MCKTFHLHLPHTVGINWLDLITGLTEGACVGVLSEFREFNWCPGLLPTGKTGLHEDPNVDLAGKSLLP